MQEFFTEKKNYFIVLRLVHHIHADKMVVSLSPSTTITYIWIFSISICYICNSHLLLTTVLSCVCLLHPWNMLLYFFPLFSLFSLVIGYLSEAFNIKTSALKKTFSNSIQNSHFELSIECCFLGFPKHIYYLDSLILVSNQECEFRNNTFLFLYCLACWLL